MPNDNAKADVDISVTDELDAADAAVISEGGFSVRQAKVRDDPAMVALMVSMNLSSGTEREPMVR